MVTTASAAAAGPDSGERSQRRLSSVTAAETARRSLVSEGESAMAGRPGSDGF